MVLVDEAVGNVESIKPRYIVSLFCVFKPLPCSKLNVSSDYSQITPW